MDEVLVAWIFMFFIAVWRLLGKNRWFKEKLHGIDQCIFHHPKMWNFLQRRRVDHHFVAGTPLFQWWFLTWLFLLYFLVRAFYLVLNIDYLKYHFLLDQTHHKNAFNFTVKLDENFAHILPPPALTEVRNVTTFDYRSVSPSQLREELKLTDWLKSMSMAAPAVALTAFFFFSLHMVRLILSIKEENSRPKDDSDILLPGTKVFVGNREAIVIGIDPKDTCLPYKVRYNPEDGLKPGPLQDLRQWVLDVKALFLPSKSDNPESAKMDWVSSESIDKRRNEENPWIAAEHEDLALLVILMPAAFIVMSVKALTRVLQVMECATCYKYEKWHKFEAPLMSTYMADLELSATMQYFTVWAFAVLCTRHFDFAGSLKKKLAYESGGEARKLVWANHFEDLMQSKSDDYHRVLSIAGLLGLWGYLLIGLLRAAFGMFFAFKVHLGYKYKALVLTYLQPVFMFSMGLCIFNMFIVLKMEDLMQPDAFGKNANLKFNACRVLLILGDVQKQVLSKLPISAYQAELLHPSLLIIECFAIVIVNSYFWTRTTSMRAREVRQLALQRCEEKPVKELSLFAKLKANKEAFLHGVVAPWVLICLVLVIGTTHRGLMETPEAPTGTGVMDKALKMLDSVFSVAGQFIALAVIVPRCLYFLQDLRFLRPHGHGSQFTWLPKGWVTGAFMIFVAIFVLRGILFLFVHPYHDYISDHIVLTMSLLAVLQMEISLAHIAWKRTGTQRGFGVMVLAWIVMFCLALNSWATAKYYHTTLAVWVAFCISIPIYGSIVFWWFGLMLNPVAVERDELQTPLQSVADGP